MLSVRFISVIADIACRDWNNVCTGDFPFIRHEFLSALEHSRAACSENGWTPHHLLVYDNAQLVAVMPGYLKEHSYGEFVFDFQWAEAYQRHRQHYYPKYITAIPFSPVSGARLCICPGYDHRQVVATVLLAIKQFVADRQISSWHLLFPDSSQAALFLELGLPLRKAVHFHWFNDNYLSFDQFLEKFNSRKRKNLRKERQHIIDQGITLLRFEGRDISDDLWETFYHFYQLTYLKRSGHGGYLDNHFFRLLGKQLPDALLMVVAYKDNKIIAAALNLKDSTTLYGRYWGCYEEYNFLHFEVCYYQGIEYCIEKQLQRFDPGAQGEHKIQRGFRPVYTYSCHWIADPDFRNAITEFLSREEKHVAIYKQQAEALLPFKTA